MSAKQPTIAYVCQYFPTLTETFVYREVAALRAQGFNVVTMSNRTPTADKLSADSEQYVGGTHYVFPVQWMPFVMAHLALLLTMPLRYLRTLLFVMTRPGESADNRRRTFGHWAGGVYLARIAQKTGVEHVHAHFTVNAATIGLVIARLLDLPFSFTVHNNIFTDRLILREKLDAANFIVSISDFSQNWLLDYAPEQRNLADKFRIVRCGITPAQFVPPATRPVNDPPLIFTVSNLAERKGMPVLVDACHLLHQRGVPFRAIIAGDGDEMPILQEKVARYGLQDVVELAGRMYQEEIRPKLAAADCFALACVTAANGDIDGIPVVLMEAMAMALPVVSTTVSGIPELVADGENGFLVPERDPAAFADALERLLTDAALRDRLGTAARKTVLDEFNVELSATALVTLFTEELGKG